MEFGGSMSSRLFGCNKTSRNSAFSWRGRLTRAGPRLGFILTRKPSHEQTRKPEAPARLSRSCGGRRPPDDRPRPGRARRRALQAAAARLRLRGARAAYRRADHDACTTTSIMRPTCRKCNEFARTVPELGTTPIETTLVDAAYVAAANPGSRCSDNLGGHWNHSFFWAAGVARRREGARRRPEVRDRRAFVFAVDDCPEKVTAVAHARFGSGWAWLVFDEDVRLEIIPHA